MHIIHSTIEYMFLQGITFALFMVLSFLFLDVLRQLDKRMPVKLCFFCLTVGCFSLSIYVLKNSVPIYVFLFGIGLLPLVTERVRYDMPIQKGAN